MFSFFIPASKIQKDRQVLRETDERMAKYSRRGLMTNFIIFLLCMAVGDLVEKEPSIATALTIGLLITTLLRGYLLFRFESLYPRAPTLWRMRYFYATLLGAAWWGLIIATETLIVGINHEAPLLWLYTIVFFSMTANAFAPYKQFLSLYQYLGLIPGAICLMFTGDMTGVIYGIVIFFFIWLLHHQCEQIADNYWLRLESNAQLAHKTESLEEEKRDTRAMAQLHRDYMLLLKKELHQLLQAKRQDRASDKNSNEQIEGRDQKPPASPNKTNANRPKLQQLYQNVSDFYQILTKEIDFETRLFNPKALLQCYTAEYSSAASEKHMDLELSISPTIPNLIEGDPARLNQIVASVITAVIDQLEGGTLFIDAEYIQERSKIGELHLLFSYQHNTQKSMFGSHVQPVLALNLELALAVGLAEAQGGTLEITTQNQGIQLRYKAKYSSNQSIQAANAMVTQFRGKKLLLVHENPRVLDAKRQELSLLGFDVTTEPQFKTAFNTLRSSIKNNIPFSAIIFHVHNDIKASADFSLQLANESDCKLIPQIIMGTDAHFRSPEMAEVITNPYVKTLKKPTSQQDFKRFFWSLFNYDEQLFTATGNTAVISQTDTKLLCQELITAGIACDLFEDEKKLITAIASTQYQCFIFVDTDASFSALYPILHEKFPNSYIIACDSQDHAQRHIHNGADIFLANEMKHLPLSLFVKTLQ